ncbi:GumC family protein [Rhizobium sp. P32RR-XVIII]|uniref:GumC family protein n=1 Tax=Rhizobium sp. P32RR-XVIII TaxID=2726738 RepID=UPI001456D9DC|nr:GumC family protein [Rhizobium sp. P32RR-XVIII]NLS01914.1 GumC family protein [Rhizobium sp. P32RR-XVIII]
MSQFDRNRVSRLPSWRSYEPAPAAPGSSGARTPVLRPGDFAKPVPEPEAVPAAETRIRELTPPPSSPPPQPERPVAAPVFDPSSPLLDVRSIIFAIWNRRLIVLGLAALGALAGGSVLPLLPQKFTATTSLYFDPRQIGLADPTTQASTISPEMISSLIDSQVQILMSGNVLRRVADTMKLAQDPAFNGGRSDDAAVVAALQKALTITRQSSTYVVSLTAVTNDPEKSAKLANQVVSSFIQEESSASTGLYENTTATLDGRLNDLRQKVQEAEQAVETFRADNDMAATEGNLISDQRLASLNTLLLTAQEKSIQAKARADAAANMSFEDVVANSQTDGSTVSSSLASLRQQYATQAAIVGSLESQMGARHPRLQAARSSLQSISDEIKGELQRMVTSARADYDQAKKAEDAIAKELNIQKALQATTSDKQVELNELQRKATAAREIYETVLKRSSQTTEEQNLPQNNIRIISEAEPPAKPDGPGKKVLLVAGVIGGLFAGFAAGAAFAILASLFAHPVIRGYFRRVPQPKEA